MLYSNCVLRNSLPLAGLEDALLAVVRDARRPQRHRGPPGVVRPPLELPIRHLPRGVLEAHSDSRTRISGNSSGPRSKGKAARGGAARAPAGGAEASRCQALCCVHGRCDRAIDGLPRVAGTGLCDRAIDSYSASHMNGPLG